MKRTLWIIPFSILFLFFFSCTTEELPEDLAAPDHYADGSGGVDPDEEEASENGG